MQHHIFLIAFFLILALLVPGIVAMRMLSTVFFADTRHPSENSAITTDQDEQTEKQQNQKQH